jgi:hypothetical protein
MKVRATVLGAVMLAVAGALNGGEALRIQVSPAVSKAPAMLTVRATIEPAADNRTLEIVAESASFFRSSQVQLEGEHGAPVSVFQFRNLPTGLYQVTAVLVGVHGPRATVTRLAKVEPSPGSAR